MTYLIMIGDHPYLTAEELVYLFCLFPNLTMINGLEIRHLHWGSIDGNQVLTGNSICRDGIAQFLYALNSAETTRNVFKGSGDASLVT